MRTSVGIVALAALLAAFPVGTHRVLAHEAAHPAESDGHTLSKEDAKTYLSAFQKLQKKRYKSAGELARKAKNPLPAKVIRWAELSAEGTRQSFAAIAEFIEQNPDWPGKGALRRNAELAMPKDLPDARVLAWFEAHPPITPGGAVRHADALTRAGHTERATDLLRETWVTMDFGRREERDFRKRFAKLLRRDDELARLDRLLWDRRYRPAKRQARRLGKDYAALAEARTALARRSPNVDWTVRQVPESLRDDPGLIYERARWRQRKKRYDGVIELLDPPMPAAPQAKKWWRLRKWAARQAFAKGDISIAYRIASGHGLDSGLGFAEGEWLAGWMALRFLNQPEAAYEHFKRFNNGVTTAISLARSAYWAGEAARELARANSKGGWHATAQRWYEDAARYGTTFYGQMASRRLNRPIEIQTAAAHPVDAAARAAFDNREMTQVVRLLGKLGETKLHKRFLLRLKALADSPADYALVAGLAREQGRTDVAVRTAKEARNADVMLFGDLYPLPSLPSTQADSQSAEPALVLAVIRQESAFYDGALSRAGARGLMQLMPRTAKRVARRLKIRYSRNRLLTDPDYNLRLGRAYLSDLADKYNGSYVLALAAYNAGPARANAWMRAFGDPRSPDVDAIDWIESIPFDETRNYVQRILESLVVYRHHLGDDDSGPVVPVAPFRSLAKQSSSSDLSCCL